MTETDNDDELFAKVGSDDGTDIKQEDENSDDDEEELGKEGYLRHQAIYIKQFKERFIVLNKNYIFFYENNKKTKIAESIDLSGYKTVQQKGAQIEITHKNNKDRNVTFAAPTTDEAALWTKMINHRINRIAS